MPYQCPLCQQSLEKNDHQWRCANNHQFDCAKEGYVNLMPVQFKHSKQPGDSAEMMQARRAFLDQNYYQPLRNAVCAALDAHMPAQTHRILDIGCGEGYYTAEIAKQFNQRNIDVYGLDIAKVAIRYAAKRYPTVSFCVASSHRLPYADASMDAVVRIYAPCKAEELARVIAPEGILVTVSPAPRHLYQLKAQVYDSVQLHAENVEEFAGFTLIDGRQLSYTMQLPGEQAANLLQMTPFAWRATPDVAARLKNCAEFDCETDFAIRVYQRL